MTRLQRWALWLVGCAACADPTWSVGTSVGDADGTDVVIGITTGASSGVAYVCGGPDTMRSHTRWIDLAPTALGLAGEADGWSIDGSETGDGWAGELISPDGETTPWSTTWAAGLVEGLYDSDEGACRAGAVVLDDGDRMQGVFCLTGSLSAQVVPVGQIVLQDGAIPVRALSNPPVEFTVTPAVP